MTEGVFAGLVILPGVFLGYRQRLEMTITGAPDSLRLMV